MMDSAYYHMNYASLVRRGVSDFKYILTIHKRPVMRSGFKVPELLKDDLMRRDLILRFGSDADDDSAERFAKSIQRSRNAVIQYVANNNWDYFVTLTLSADKLAAYNVDRYDFEAVSKIICQFFVNYSRRSGKDTGFKYLLIPEFHKDGAVHFHGVLKGVNPSDLFINEHGYFDFKPYRDRFGFVNISREKADLSVDPDNCVMGKIKNLEACAKYISKYITKDMFCNEHLKKGMHLYYASRGLKKDKKISVGTPVLSIDDCIEQGLVSFENEYCAKFEMSECDDPAQYITPFDQKCCSAPSIKSLSSKARDNAKRKIVYRFVNDPRFELPFSGTEVEKIGINVVWEYIMKEFCSGVYDEYDLLDRYGLDGEDKYAPEVPAEVSASEDVNDNFSAEVYSGEQLSFFDDFGIRWRWRSDP